MEVILDTRNQLTFLEKDVILMGFGKRVCELLAVIASLLLIGPWYGICPQVSETGDMKRKGRWYGRRWTGLPWKRKYVRPL